MDEPGFPETVETSRRRLLDEIGVHADVTFVRPPGNVGDELIWLGTRALLADLVVREISHEEIAGAQGELALIAGSGAWSRWYNEYMPELLAIAERRFERVIVLPSSFETSEVRVRDALDRTPATIFAREEISYARIASLCRARQAHDCALFADLSGVPRGDEGTLVALREDAEAPPGTVPMGSDDISATCESLDAWLATIARHSLIRTDRAHVTIASAMLGKRVEMAPSSNGKVEALVATLPAELRARVAPTGDLRGRPREPVPPAAVATRERLRATAAAMPPPAGAVQASDAPARVTALVLSRDRPAHVIHAARSVLDASVAARVLVIDNDSASPTRAALRELAASETAVEVRLADRNLGCAGGRALGCELIDTEFVLFLDDDAELMPGALEHLMADLDAHPEASAVTALVVRPDGIVYHFSGWPERSRESVRFPLDGSGLALEDPALPPTGPCGWLPGTAALVRTDLLRETPIDAGMTAYYEDNEWSLRVSERRPAAFRRCREALALHHLAERTIGSGPFVGTGFLLFAQALPRLDAHAHFLRRHGIVLETQLDYLVPELASADGRVDTTKARLLLRYLDGTGPAAFLESWLNGSLDPLLAPEEGRITDERLAEIQRQHHVLTAERDALCARLADLEARAAWLQEREATLQRIEAGGWWRLRGRLAPVLRLASMVRRAAGRGRP